MKNIIMFFIFLATITNTWAMEGPRVYHFHILGHENSSNYEFYDELGVYGQPYRVYKGDKVYLSRAHKEATKCYPDCEVFIFHHNFLKLSKVQWSAWHYVNGKLEKKLTNKRVTLRDEVLYKESIHREVDFLYQRSEFLKQYNVKVNLALYGHLEDSSGSRGLLQNTIFLLSQTLKEGRSRYDRIWLYSCFGSNPLIVKALYGKGRVLLASPDLVSLAPPPLDGWFSTTISDNELLDNLFDFYLPIRSSVLPHKWVIVPIGLEVKPLRANLFQSEILGSSYSETASFKECSVFNNNPIRHYRYRNAHFFSGMACPE